MIKTRSANTVIDGNVMQYDFTYLVISLCERSKATKFGKLAKGESCLLDWPFQAMAFRDKLTSTK